MALFLAKKYPVGGFSSLFTIICDTASQVDVVWFVFGSFSSIKYEATHIPAKKYKIC